ncbi:MAG: hypothetical protein JRF25_06140 [Deltaproteobacteria bacterium]|nr:hypothetical protein [Deltaproteobacteria bacterium]
MQQRLRNKIGLMTSILFLLITFVPSVFAAEYVRIYRFEAPKIVTLPNGRQLLKMKDTWQQDDSVGAPILPVKTAKIFISATEKVVSIVVVCGKLKTVEGSYLIQHATTPYPVSHKGPVKIDKPDPNIYETDASYPSTVHRTRKPQFLSGVKITLVDLKPVRYNPVEAQLKYYEKMKVMIRTEKQKRPDGVMSFRNLPKDRENILRTIENKDDFLKLHPSFAQSETDGTESLSEEPSPVEDPREYVVITTAELLEAEAFKTLTSYRSSAQGGGYTTYIEDIANINNNYSGVDLAEKMRNFIRDMYNNYGTQYVVLGGDCDGAPGNQVIPTRGCYAQVGTTTDTNIPSDLYFGCLDGSWNSNGNEYWGEPDDGVDWESEVYVGRIAADNDTEARNQIAKIIAFETGNRQNKTLLIGEKLDAEPTWGGDRMDWVYTYMDSTPKTELYDRDGVWPNSQLLTLINSDEHHWINHLGHSNVTYNMKLSNSDVALMANTHYLLVYSQGCYSGSMDNRSSSGGYGGTDCFGEALTNTYNDRGAFAYIGNSRYGWYNPGFYVEGASNLVHKEFVEAVFTDNITKLGEANQESKTDLNLDSGLYRWIAFETNLIGCPATELRPVVCSSHADCDDGIYCNGAETCVNSVCQNGTPPCTDDGLFCNGSEGCDEENDTCTSSGDPCAQGTICVEENDQCELTSCGNGVCEEGENCDTCDDCISGQGGTCGACFKGVCNGECHPVKEGPDCADCAPSYCCGDGFCEGDEDNSSCEIDCPSTYCGDGVCEGGEDSYNCELDCGVPPGCGDDDCNGDENQCTCPDDCGTPPSTETKCSDGIDNDCDLITDCSDGDCFDDPACTCGAKKSPCNQNSDCCSNRCSKKGVCL